MLDPTVRLPVAAAAIGTTPKALAHWLGQGFGLLCEADRTGQKWHRVAPLDLVRLALVRRLLPYGFSVAEAEGILLRSIDDRLFALPLAKLPCDWGTVQGRLAGWTLAVSRTGDGRIRVSMESRQRTLGDLHGSERILIDLGAVAAETRAGLATPPGRSQHVAGASGEQTAPHQAVGKLNPRKAPSPPSIKEP